MSGRCCAADPDKESDTLTCAQSNPSRPRLPDLAPWLLAAILLVGLSALGPARAQPAGSILSQQALDEGIAYRRQGQLHLAVGSLQRACAAAADDTARLRATGELGATLLQARRLDEAAQALHQAHAFFEGVDRARVAIDLGNLAVLQGRPAIAQGHYQQALQLGGAERIGGWRPRSTSLAWPPRASGVPCSIRWPKTWPRCPRARKSCAGA